MTKRSKWPAIYIAVLLVAAVIFTVWRMGGDTQTHGEAAPAIPGDIPDMVGTWVGTWTDTIYSVTGNLTWEITQDGDDLAATGTIDLSNLGMGQEPGTATGSVVTTRSGRAVSFSFESATVGNGSGTIEAGTVAGSGAATEAPVAFGNFTFQGTVTNEIMWGTFDYEVGGAGRARLTKQSPVEAESWGDIKDRYREDDE
jgi:hypothetical protein